LDQIYGYPLVAADLKQNVRLLGFAFIKKYKVNTSRLFCMTNYYLV